MDASSSRQATAQVWSPATYERNARFVSDLAGDVMAWLDPRPGEKILDVGCGDGALTLTLQQAGVDVLGVDSSAELLEAAAKLGVAVQLMDGQSLSFDGEFDAVFSNAALHWMRDAESVINGIHRALKPGGRFVAEFGGHGNVAAIVTAMLAVAAKRGGNTALAMPWFFPSPDHYRRLLEARGFAVKRIGLFPRPTRLPTGMAEWLKLFRRPFFQQFGKEEENALNDTVQLLVPSLCDADGNWTADYVRLRVEAVR